MPRNNRGGWIETLPSGKFRAGFSNGRAKDGSQRKVQVTFDTLKEAKFWLNEQLESKSKGRLVVESSRFLEDWLADWLKGLKTRRAGNTVQQYQFAAEKVLIPELGNVRLGQLSPMLIEQMIGRVADKGVSSYMQKLAMKTLRAALNAAVKLRMIYSNPARDVEAPRHRGTEIRPWTREEAQQFLGAIEGHRLYALFALALDTGMRQGELLGLKWYDVALTVPTIRVRNSLEHIGKEKKLKEVKTAKGRREIFVGAHAWGALREHLLHTKGHHGRVFMTKQGNWLCRSNISWTFAKLCDKAGVRPIPFHGLRHTCATLLLQAGVGIRTVSERLGHANVNITLSIYSHVLPGQQEEAAKVSGSIFVPLSHPVPTVEHTETEVQVNDKHGTYCLCRTCSPELYTDH